MSVLALLASALLKLVAVAAVALVTTALVEELARPLNLPPYPGGRRPLPFVGHRLLLPASKSWVTFRRWHEAHGPFLAFWNGATPTIVIGRGEVRPRRLRVRG